jgi:glycosyltransferase involved in cell wall biosynthesis
VASRIPGHLDAIDDKVTGMLADSDEDFERGLETMLTDPLARRRLGRAAAERVAPLTWEATARGILAVLAGEVRTRGRAPGRP